MVSGIMCSEHLLTLTSPLCPRYKRSSKWNQNQSLNQVLDIPVLILACKGDPNHPVSTAEALRNLRWFLGFPRPTVWVTHTTNHVIFLCSHNTRLHISESYAEGKLEWPGFISEFLESLNPWHIIPVAIWRGRDILLQRSSFYFNLSFFKIIIIWQFEQLLTDPHWCGWPEASWW